MKQATREGKPGINVLKDPDFIEHLKESHLKAMEAEENLDDTTKKEIGRQIHDWATTPGHNNKNHPAFGFVTRKDNESWLPGGSSGSAGSSGSGSSPIIMPGFSSSNPPRSRTKY
jgi:hypothetical protein